MVYKKFYDKKPKYEIYFKKKNGRRWYRSGTYHWSKKPAVKDLSYLRKSKKYDYKLKPYKGVWK